MERIVCQKDDHCNMCGDDIQKGQSVTLTDSDNLVCDDCYVMKFFDSILS